MAWTFYNAAGEVQINDGGVQASAAVFTGKVDLQAQLLVGNGGTTGIAISANGEVTMAAQPTVFVPGTGQALNATGDGTDYPMVFGGTERVDQNSDFDNVSTFTAPVTGNYLFTIQIAFGGLSSMESSIARFRVGGSGLFHGWIYDATTLGADSVNGLVSLGFSIIIDLDASDAVTIVLDISGGSKAADVSLANSWLGVVLVS